MSAPIKYGEHVPVSPGATCELCGTGDGRAVTDHCHAHGWVRGVICGGCNTRMSLVDRKITPRVSDSLLESMVAHVGRCPECVPMAVDALGPTRSMQSLYLKESRPARRELRIRLSDDLYSRLVAAAAESGRSMSSLINLLLNQSEPVRAPSTTVREK